MKRLTFTLIIIIFFNTPAIYAQLSVALHTEGDGGVRVVNYYYQSDGFQKACADAANGDTIYLPGGTFPPPALIAKQLVIYGAGHYPSATSATGRTIINGSFTLGEGADNFHMEGLDVTGGLVTGSNVSVNFVNVSRCRFGSSISFPGDRTNMSTGITFNGCLFEGGITLQNIQNAAIFNSILSSGAAIYRSLANIFKNNIFFITTYVFQYDGNNQIHDNIFMVGHNSYLEYVTAGNVFRNNAIQASAPNYGTGAQAENNWTGINFSSLFQDQSGTAFSYTNDYRLVDPVTYTGTDGTQIGIYGGVFPYREGAVPVIPRIINAGVSPKSDAEGNIQVNVTVEAQEAP